MFFHFQIHPKQEADLASETLPSFSSVSKYYPRLCLYTIISIFKADFMTLSNKIASSLLALFSRFHPEFRSVVSSHLTGAPLDNNNNNKNKNSLSHLWNSPTWQHFAVLPKTRRCSLESGRMKC